LVALLKVSILLSLNLVVNLHTLKTLFEEERDMDHGVKTLLQSLFNLSKNTLIMKEQTSGVIAEKDEELQTDQDQQALLLTLNPSQE
jgi:phosphoribosyl-AMP cyclohydrolase